MNRKFFNTLLIYCTVVSAGCMTYSETIHTSIYHGTDDHAGLTDFYYVQYGITGSASAEYDLYGVGMSGKDYLLKQKESNESVSARAKPSLCKRCNR